MWPEVYIRNVAVQPRINFVFRYAEILLNYAANAVKLPVPMPVYTVVNLIRQRVPV